MSPGPISRSEEVGGEDPRPDNDPKSLLQKRDAEVAALREALNAARLSLYKISTQTQWKPIGGSIPAAMAQEARDGLAKVDQLAPSGS